MKQTWIAGDDGQVRYERIDTDPYTGARGEPYRALVLPSATNAEFIVRACNSHAAILEALKVGLRHTPDCPFCGRNNAGHSVCTAEDCPGIEAIAKAEGEAT